MTKEELQKVREALLNAVPCTAEQVDEQREALAILDNALAQPEQEPVHQWRKKGTAQWWDGYPDNNDGDGPYQTRTLYAAPVAQHYPAQWATFLHYPDCWDTAAYPTLESAIHEALAWSGCSICTEKYPKQPAVRTGGCTLCGFCAATGEAIAAKKEQP